MGLVYATTHNLPVIMTLNEQKHAILIHELKKKSPYRWGGDTLPRSVALLPRFSPRGQILPPSPLIGE